MEINQSFNLLQRINPPTVEAERVAHRVGVQPGLTGDPGQRDLPGLQVAVKAGDNVCGAAHEVRKTTKNNGNQEKPYNFLVERMPSLGHHAGMDYDAEKMRRTIREFMNSQNPPLRPTPWALDAGLGETTLSSFLNSRDPKKSLTIRVIFALAKQAGVHPYVLMGMDPPGQPDTLSTALRAADKLLEHINSVSAATGDDLKAVKDLLRSARRGSSESASPPKTPRSR